MAQPTPGALAWTHEPPSETVRPAAAREVRSLLLGLVATLVLANVAAVVLLEVRNPNRGNWLVREKAALAVTGAAAETLLIGDSTCNQGLIPSALAPALGGPVLNLCAIGTLGVVGDTLLLDRYLATHPAPRRVVVSHAPDVWFRPPNLFNVGLLEPGANEAIALKSAGLGGPFSQAKMLAGRWLPLYTSTRSLADFIRRPSSTWGRVFSLDAGGFMAVDTANPEQQTRDLREMSALLRETRGPLPPSTVAALKRLGELGRQHGFRVYLLPSALAAPVVAGEGFAAFADRLRAAVAEALAAGGVGANVAWLTSEFRPFPTSQMELSDHLLVGGAEVFTAAVAAQLRRAEGL